MSLENEILREENKKLKMEKNHDKLKEESKKLKLEERASQDRFEKVHKRPISPK